MYKNWVSTKPPVLRFFFTALLAWPTPPQSTVTRGRRICRWKCSFGEWGRCQMLGVCTFEDRGFVTPGISRGRGFIWLFGFYGFGNVRTQMFGGSLWAGCHLCSSLEDCTLVELRSLHLCRSFFLLDVLGCQRRILVDFGHLLSKSLLCWTQAWFGWLLRSDFFLCFWN